MEILLQIDGKSNGRMTIEDSTKYADIISAAKISLSEEIQEKVLKVVYIPKKLVNIITKRLF